MERAVVYSFLLFCPVIYSIFFDGVDACWDDDSLQLGETSEDYDIMVGSDLIVNCSLTTNRLPLLNKIISSSDLVIERRNEDLSEFSQAIDDRSLQLKIPKATENDTGVYICKLKLSAKSKVVVCGTNVNVGYPPAPIKEFACINKNFESLYCTWSAENNNILTRYTIVTYLLNNPYLILPCPNTTVQPNSCEWSKDTDPKFLPYTRNFTFTVTGSNSLGITVNNFTVDLCSVVIPSIPENLKVTNIFQESATISWKSPMKMCRNLPLMYEMSISLQNSSLVGVYYIENNTKFDLENLIPDTVYTVSLRFRLKDSELTEWSDYNSLTFRTPFDGNPPDTRFVITDSLVKRVKNLLHHINVYYKRKPDVLELQKDGQV